jgi:AcrR family transcriptional regulator
VPRVVDRSERLDSIVGAVRRVLERDGVEQTTMRNVANEMGSTTGLLTHWVPDRAGLLLLALKASADDAARRAYAALARRPRDVAAALDEFIPLDDTRRSEMKVWLGFWALAISDPALQDEHRDRYRAFRAVLLEHLRALGLSTSDARTATDQLMTTIDGIAVSAMFDPDYWTPTRQRRHLREVVSSALGDL